MLRCIIAIVLLLPALYLLRLAQWICPEIRQQVAKDAWLDCPQDWDRKVN